MRPHGTCGRIPYCGYSPYLFLFLQVLLQRYLFAAIPAFLSHRSLVLESAAGASAVPMPVLCWRECPLAVAVAVMAALVERVLVAVPMLQLVVVAGGGGRQQQHQQQQQHHRHPRHHLSATESLILLVRPTQHHGYHRAGIIIIIIIILIIIIVIVILIPDWS